MIRCIKCFKEFDETNFYTYKNGNKTKKCKKCYTLNIDNYQPKTFLPLLEDMDIPFIADEWLAKVRWQEDHPHNTGSVFERYLATMKLAGYRSFTFSDSLLFYYNHCLNQKLKEENDNAKVIL